MNSTKPPLLKSRDAFEIAIICALPLETDAIIALFDHHHDDKFYGKARGDPNAYSTGTIGRHNVVVAHLPGMGKVAAGNIAAFCRMSFPNIELALVVGICGGAPSYEKGSIFLGDVIISTGIVQYDLGGQYPDKFKVKDTLEDSVGRPGLEIRSLLAKLATAREHERLQASTKRYLSQVPATHAGWCMDALFPSDYRHKHQESSNCDVCSSWDGDTDSVCEESLRTSCIELGCDIRLHVTRQDRLAEKGETNQAYGPTIHFGRFACGDTVMKSGHHRDQLVLKKGVIGFEMESVGVWEVSPCVVIKGVADYADSHKNKEWQEYAAASGAATTKAFLEHWDATVKDAEGEAQLLKNLAESLHFPEMNERKNAVEIQSPSTFQWIFESNIPHDGLKRNRHPSEGEWDSFEDWLVSDQPIYWISGKPGAGNSTLMKFLLYHPQTGKLLEKWNSTTIVISHFFWKPGSQMQKSFKGLLCSLLHQLLSQQAISPDLLYHFMNQCRKSPADWDKYELSTMLLQYRDNISQPLCIFIDALDEVHTQQDTHELLHLIKNLACTKIKICVSSRPERMFQLCLESCPMLKMHDLTRSDIEEYSRHAFKKWTILKTFDWETEDLVQIIGFMADGIFIWAVLVTKSLIRGLNNGDSREQIFQRLHSMPPDLMDLYHDILSRSAADRPIYQKFLSVTLNLLLYEEEGPRGLFDVHRRTSAFEVMVAMDPQLLDAYVIKGEPVQRDDLLAKSQACEMTLEVACAGLLDFRKARLPYETEGVTFTHRSALDFLRDTMDGRSLWEPYRLSKADMCILRWKLRLARARFYANEEGFALSGERACLFDSLRNFRAFRTDDDPPMAMLEYFLQLAWRQVVRGYHPPIASYDLRFVTPWPRTHAAMFLVEVLIMNYHDFVDRILKDEFDDTEAHEIMYCAFYKQCAECDYRPSSKYLSIRRSNPSSIRNFLIRGYNPNWNIAQNTKQGLFRTPWIIFIIGILNSFSEWYAMEDETIGSRCSNSIKEFLISGASLETRFPAVFYLPLYETIAYPFTTDSRPTAKTLTSWHLYIELNVKVLLELIIGFTSSSHNPIVGLDLSKADSYMEVTGFKRDFRDKIPYVVKRKTDSDLIVEALRRMLTPVLTREEATIREPHVRQENAEKYMRVETAACKETLESLLPKCALATEELCWRGTPWGLYE